jgi:transcriptional regulator with XRE-family HTH domain
MINNERKIMTSQYQKINHVLPTEVVDAFKTINEDIPKRNAYIKALRNQEWSLQSLADVHGVTRERIRQICNGDYETSAREVSVAGFPLPTPPLKPVREKKIYPEPRPDALAKMLELQPLAQQVRSHSPRYRKEAEEYSALIYETYKQDGVSLFRLAKYLGVTHGSLRFRLARYGYMEKNGSTNSCYKPILDKNRYALQS